MGELLAGYANYASTEAIVEDTRAANNVTPDSSVSLSLSVSLSVSVSWSWTWSW